MKLTVVTAVFNAIKSGNRENLIRCVRSVAALKTEHEHLIYDGGSTDGTVELLRELEREGQRLDRRACAEKKIEEWLAGVDDAGNIDANLSEVTFTASRKEKKTPRFVPLTEAVRTVVHYQTTAGSYPPDESSIPFCADENKGGGLNSHSCLRVVSEPDTGIYNALNKGVRDAQGEWFYVLGCDDYLCCPWVLDQYIQDADSDTQVIAATMFFECSVSGTRKIVSKKFTRMSDLSIIFCGVPVGHQGEVLRTELVRKYFGFDERYHIAADADMLLKAHDDAVKFQYFFEPFAFFSAGGTADASGKKSQDELCLVLSRHFGIDSNEMQRYFSKRMFPLKKIFAYLFHPDLAYRIAARWMLWRMTKPWIRVCLYPLVKLSRCIRYGTT